MATHETYKFKNEPHERVEQIKEWIRNNPPLARRNPDEANFFEIEVFGYNHEREAKALYEALKQSGYLKNHPLFKIRIDPM